MQPFFQIRKRSALEEAEVVMELEPEHKERTVMELKLTDGLGLVKGGIKVFEDIGLNKKRVATTRQGIMRLLTCCEEILKEKKESVSQQTSLFDFFKSPSGTGSLLLLLGMMILMTTLPILRLHLLENPF